MVGPQTVVASVTACASQEGMARVLRGGVFNMAGAVVGAGLNLAVIIAITRAFSQETVGLLFSATSVLQLLAAVSNLGTPDSPVYFIARLRELGSNGGTRRLLRFAAGPAAPGRPRMTRLRTAGGPGRIPVSHDGSRANTRRPDHGSGHKCAFVHVLPEPTHFCRGL